MPVTTPIASEIEQELAPEARHPQVHLVPGAVVQRLAERDPAASPIDIGTKMKWNSVVTPNWVRARSSVFTVGNVCLAPDPRHRRSPDVNLR